MTVLRNIEFQLLLLQLEEYDLARYLRVIAKTRGVPPKHDFRKPLVWTQKMKLIYGVSIGMLLATIFAVNYSNIHPVAKIFVYVVTGIVHYFFHFVFVTLATIVLMPIDIFIKEFAVARAKSKIRKLKNLKIIGVAGSYGKTGMKEFIATVLSQKYNVLKTGGSVNTPFAIAELINNKLTSHTEVFVVEMGEYYKGDIKNICSIAKPDIAVVTGINEAHLERLKSVNTAVATIFEIAENMNPDGHLILNGNDKNVIANYKEFTGKQNIYIYANKNRGEFDQDLPGYIININKNKVFFPLLGKYNLDKIDAAIEIAKRLGVSDLQIVKGIKNISPIPHRLQPVINKATGTIIIDDSYNGNPDGVMEAINTLALFRKRKKIYVTPGLVEMGEKSREIHYNIGKRLARVADTVVLIKNSVTPDIERGLLENGYDTRKIVWFENAGDAYRDIKNYAGKDSVVLLQNDWPDNYL